MPKAVSLFECSASRFSEKRKRLILLVIRSFILILSRVPSQICSAACMGDRDTAYAPARTNEANLMTGDICLARGVWHSGYSFTGESFCVFIILPVL